MLDGTFDQVLSDFPSIFESSNLKRARIYLFQRLAREYNVQFELLEGGTVISLKHQGTCRLIHGYKLPINNAASSSICDDKAALSSLLKKSAIPCVEHQVFVNPNQRDLVSEEGNWEQMISFAKCMAYQLVVKIKDGTGGEDVYHTTNQRDFEAIVGKLFTKSQFLSLSPFYDIRQEYRIVVHNGEEKVTFFKERPFVVGDGESTVLQLIAKYFKARENTEKWNKIMPDFPLCPIPWQYIPQKEEPYTFQWKHNLGQGSRARMLHHPSKAIEMLLGLHLHERDENLLYNLHKLALSAVDAVGISICSVDIIELKDTQELKVMEINSGLMMDNFIEQHGNIGEKIGFEIYKAIFLEMFPHLEDSTF